MTAAGTGAAIALKGCAKTFAGVAHAVGPIDLDVAAGETLVLLGPSGCGKTTLLRMIAGLESPDAGGRILFDGQDVTPLPIERRNVGMVFQSYALFPNMSVIENVAYGLRVRRVDRSTRLRQAADVLAMMRIGELAGRRIEQLSGGQRQRVALARALAVRPRVLLLDEPLTALDAQLRDALRSEIDALLRSLKITAVYVTHDQAEALALADRVVVMRQGGIAQIGAPREIYFRPANAFVADFVGMTNRLSGNLKEGRFECASGAFPINAPDRAQALLAFRPESIGLAADHPAALRLRVERVQFLGKSQRVWLTGTQGESLTADLEATAYVEIGSLIGLMIDPDAAVPV